MVSRRGGAPSAISIPLTGQHDLADALTDRLLATNAAHLAWAR